MGTPIRYKLGKKPARPGAVKMRFGGYATPALPTPPDQFGHDAIVNPYHMLGNDSWGNCAWAGAAHETYLWTAEGGERARITTADVLIDYAACTGFDPTKPETDQGTDMQAGASYRRNIGIRDALAARHKIGAYVALEAGNLDQLKTATWLFSAVGVGLTVGDNQQDQFSVGVPWDGATGKNPGGHYVPVIAYRNGFFWCVSWGKVQPITPEFIEAQNDESIAYLSSDFLKGGKSLEGFDLAALQDDLSELTKE